MGRANSVKLLKNGHKKNKNVKENYVGHLSGSFIHTNSYVFTRMDSLGAKAEETPKQGRRKSQFKIGDVACKVYRRNMSAGEIRRIRS